MRLPVLEEIKGLLVTDEADPFGNNISCLGYKTRNRQRCPLQASNKDGRRIAAMLVSLFATLDDAPHEDGFYNVVKHLIELLHCTPRKHWKESHAAAALRKFEAWKHERTLAFSKAAEPAEAPTSGEVPMNVEKAAEPVEAPAGDGVPEKVQKEADASLSKSDSVTPTRKTSKRDDYADAPVPEADLPSASTSSPGDDSIFDLSVVSPADTNVTTPGSLLATDSPEPKSIGVLPIDYNRKPSNLSNLVEGLNDESPGIPTGPDTPTEPDPPTGPDTPTRPPPRRQTKPAQDEKPATLLIRTRMETGNPYAHDAHLGTIRIPRSQTTKKERHKELRDAILQPFTDSERQVGRVYIWNHKGDHTADPPLIKVGWTTYTMTKRRTDSEVKCYAEVTDEYWESPEPFVGANRVEKIAHKHLREWNVLLKICKECSIGHKEWFEREAGEVLPLLEAWTRFVRFAYVGGKNTEAARREVEERVMDMHPDVGSLASFVEVEAAKRSALGPVSETQHGTADEVVVNADSEATVLLESGKITISAKPGALSVETALAPHPPHHPIPERPSTKPKWRGKHFRQPFKTARQMISSHQPPRPAETTSLPGRDGSSRRPASIQGNENRVKQIFDKYVMKRFEPELRSWEREVGTQAQDHSERRLQERAGSWMPIPRRTKTFADERGVRERGLKSWMPIRPQRTATFA
ncbi:hypothetical protein GE09DRAFT_1191837 [Coniochaeta sp. 2T2.1]|nr:hypothetical protein GE09DRAFT_1191837 [Coniochaeta sp. 2T2.1]